MSRSSRFVEKYNFFFFSHTSLGLLIPVDHFVMASYASTDSEIANIEYTVGPDEEEKKNTY